MLRGPSSYISNIQAAQSWWMKINSWEVKSRWSVPAVFPPLSCGLVFQLGGEIPPTLVTWSTRDMAQTERRAEKAVQGISTTRERPLAGESPRQAKRHWLVEYMSTQTENSKCIICTIPSRSTPTNVTCSRPWIGSTTNASCARKEWIPRPKRFSDERAAPSLWTVRKAATRIAESSAGISPIPRASTTDRGRRKGVG